MSEEGESPTKLRNRIWLALAVVVVVLVGARVTLEYRYAKQWAHYLASVWTPGQAVDNLLATLTNQSQSLVRQRVKNMFPRLEFVASAEPDHDHKADSVIGLWDPQTQNRWDLGFKDGKLRSDAWRSPPFIGRWWVPLYRVRQACELIGLSALLLWVISVVVLRWVFRDRTIRCALLFTLSLLAVTAMLLGGTYVSVPKLPLAGSGWTIQGHWPLLGKHGFAPALLGLSAVLWTFGIWIGSLPTKTDDEPHCQRCGYSLTGNVSGTCPECGTTIPEPGEASMN